MVSKLVLVSSGPFEASYAKQIMPRRLSRLSVGERKEAQKLLIAIERGVASDKDLALFGRLMSIADSYDPLSEDTEESLGVNMGIYQSVWGEAERMRKSGKLLVEGKKIICPVTVIHGDYDPGPLEGVKVPLSTVLRKKKFLLLKHCGHHPWLERQAKDEFYKILRGELIA